MNSSNQLRKYIDIINEMTLIQEINEMEKMNKVDAGYTDRSESGERCSRCVHFQAPNQCEIVDGLISPNGWCRFYDKSTGQLGEKWGEPTTVSPAERGKYAGKTKEELLKAYRALKKSGPHRRGSPEYGRMRELAFAIRAKSGCGAVE